MFDPINLQICDPARPTTAVSGGPGRRRWEFMRLPDERVEDLDRRGARVGAARTVGRAPGQRPHRTPRRLHVPGAGRRRGGRPVGSSSPATPRTRCRRSPGRACAPGIRDAANLAWKLDLVLDGRAAPDAARDLRRGAPAERQSPRSTSRSSSARSSACPTRPRRRPATRRWPPTYDGRCQRGARPARHRRRLRRRGRAARRRAVPAGRRRRALVRRRARRRVAARHRRRRCGGPRPGPRPSGSRPSAARSSTCRPPRPTSRVVRRARRPLGAPATRLPPLRHRDRSRRRGGARRRPPPATDPHGGPREARQPRRTRSSSSSPTASPTSPPPAAAASAPTR